MSVQPERIPHIDDLQNIVYTNEITYTKSR
jgi:hypothetical protein